jgi:hypothetical protein
MLPVNPSHYHRYNIIGFLLLQRPALFYSRPLLNACPATDAVTCWAIGFFTWVDALVFLLEDATII